VRHFWTSRTLCMAPGECLDLRWEGARDLELRITLCTVRRGGRWTRVALTGQGRWFSRTSSGGLAVAVSEGMRFLAGGAAESTFRDPAALDCWARLGSVLMGRAAVRFATERDFNGSERLRPYDVGAYQTRGRRTNPSWGVGLGFKVERTTRGAAAC
jgi:hypothetical protein